MKKSIYIFSTLLLMVYGEHCGNLVVNKAKGTKCEGKLTIRGGGYPYPIINMTLGFYLRIILLQLQFFQDYYLC